VSKEDIDRMCKRFDIKKATPELIKQFERLLDVETKRQTHDEKESTKKED
jgi:hypothetical protein